MARTRTVATRSHAGPAPALFVSLPDAQVGPGEDRHVVLFKVAPETLQAGDVMAFSTHDVVTVVGVHPSPTNRGMVVITHSRTGTVHPADNGRQKRRGRATVALVRRDGVRRQECPQGTPFD